MSQTPQDATTDANAAEPGPVDHPAVEAVLASLQRLDEIPVDEHPAVFQQAHERLRSALTQAHQGPGNTSHGD